MRNLILTITFVLVAIPSFAGQAKKANPCSLVTKAEVHQAVGTAKIGDPVVDTSAGAPACNFTVNEGSSVSVMVAPYNDWAQFEAQSKQMQIKITPVPNVGDRSYFAEVGPGIQQLHTFKGKNYLIVTVSVGADAQKNRDVAVKVMQKALPRI